MFMEDQDNTQILKDLSEENFKLLLEEAYRGDSLKNTQNSLLKSLNKECQKKDEQEEKAFSGQSRRSRYSSSFKSKNEHITKKRTDELGKNKNYSSLVKKEITLHTTSSPGSEIVSASSCVHESSEHAAISNHYSSNDDSSKEMTTVGAKSKGEYEHLDASESVNSSLNCPPEVTQLISCDSTPEKNDSGIETSSSKVTPGSTASPSGPSDIEMQELKQKSTDFDFVPSEEDWGTSYNFHHRRKSDGDGGQDYATKIDSRIGFPLKKCEPNGTGTRQPLHKSASDFIMRDVSDVINKNLDINENPMKCIRQQHSSRTSEFMNCSNETSKCDKSSKQNNKKTPKNLLVYKSDEVENFRGDQNVDELINYINMSGKKSESRIYKSLTFIPLESKSKNNDTESKKCLMKETRSSQNKNNLKQNKKHSIENGEKGNCPKEEDKPTPEQGLSNGIDKVSESISHKANSDSSAKTTMPPISNSTSTSFSEGYVSGLTSDFYAFSDAASPQKVDEGFRVVTKKHRKRRQPKKSDSYRKHTPNSGPPGNTILRDFQQDRRKSTSSMPPSENSSDNSDDADSVYSLPVSSGSAPQATTRPHTTPSSMSSTPQTSYADITRMSMMHSSLRERPRPLGSVNSSKLSQTSQTPDITNHNEHASITPSTHKIANIFPRRDKYIKPTELSTNNTRPILKNTRENVTQTDPIPNEKLTESLNSTSNKNDNQSILEKPPTTSDSQLNKTLDTVINSNLSSNKEASKTLHCSSEECDIVSTKNKLNLKMGKNPHPQKITDVTSPVNNILIPSQPNVKVIFNSPSNKIDSTKTSNIDLPPVIMDEFTCTSFNMDCNISFGFELEELENINLYGSNGAKELDLPLLPKMKNNVKESTSLEAGGSRSLKEESSERTNISPADKSSSPSEVLLINSGHLTDQGGKKDFEKEAQSYNYHQLVDYFKSKWGSFLQDGSNGGCTYDIKVVRYSSTDC